MKTALITGASRGLGAALAKALAPTHHIIAVGRTVGGLEELDDAIKSAGGHATLAPMDITVPEAMQQLCRSIHDRWGGLDLWCHTAIHAGPLTPVADMGEKDLTKSIATNITATSRLITYVSPLLQTTGTAVFFDDDRSGQTFFGHYSTTKSAQINLARTWASEVAKSGPHIRILSPAPMPTATHARFFPGADPAKLTHPNEEAKRLLSLILP